MNDSPGCERFSDSQIFLTWFPLSKDYVSEKNIHVSNQTIGFHKMFLKFEVIMFTLYLFLYNTQYMKEHAW